MPELSALPIDASLPEIVRSLRERKNLVLVAEPGAGKTTRVPRALLDAGFAEHGEILVLQPRRIATRMAARRVAEELGEEVGGRIGYQVRFEQAISNRTRVCFVTEGILTRKLVGDPSLRKVSVVVLDEFHERHLHGDVGLALLRKLQARRPELRIVVMSATLAAEPLAQFLGAESSASRAGRIPWRSSTRRSHRPCAARDARGAGAARAGSPRSDRRRADVLARRGRDSPRRERVSGDRARGRPGVALLHGDLPARDQDHAVARGARHN